jgi:pimeloyl-ACP methyl ester carboxylesterase
MARLVLVHGAFCNARVWGDDFIRLLTEAGHSVETIDLPSHGLDSTPRSEVSLSSYADAVVQQLKTSTVPAALIGHSMAGLVITQAADRFVAQGGELDRLIYVAAVLPRNGKSQNDYTTLPEGEGDALRGGLEISGEPKVATLKPGVAGPALFGHCSPEVAASAEAGLEPQVIRVLFTPVEILDDRPLKRSYVVCSEDFAIPTALQRRMASETPGVDVREIHSDHSPFLSHTKEFAELILDVVAS